MVLRKYGHCDLVQIGLFSRFSEFKIFKNQDDLTP